jgi:hypothetical protein
MNNKINELLKEVNGDDKMIGNYTSNSQDFFIKVENETKIYNLMIYMKTNNVIEEDNYGDEIGGLIYGIKIYKKINEMSNKTYIKTIYSVKDWMNKENYKSFGEIIIQYKLEDIVELEVGGEIGVELEDDFTQMIEHNISIKGFY